MHPPTSMYKNMLDLSVSYIDVLNHSPMYQNIHNPGPLDKLLSRI